MKVVKVKEKDQIRVSAENRAAFVQVSQASLRQFLNSLPSARIQRLGVDAPWPTLTA